MTDTVLEALWKKVVDDWENDGAHTAFVEYCHGKGQLLEAAVRYRGMAGDHLRGPNADKRLSGIAALAVAALESGRTPPRESTADWPRILLIVFFLGASAALLAALYS